MVTFSKSQIYIWYQSESYVYLSLCNAWIYEKIQCNARIYENVNSRSIWQTKV